MTTSEVIEVKNVSKRFKITMDKKKSLKEKIITLFDSNKPDVKDFFALKDINIKIEKGKTVGLIGKNGSGKSTLLKLLTSILYPTTGEIKIKGRVSSLLELGAGFHPDFTGVENIYNNAAIFGLTKKEINEKLNTIIEFSELEDYIYNPIRTYSSGMYARLAFSVAINVNADILLIDEVLAVGDIKFQKKCFAKLVELKQKEVTIVLVAHDIDAIQKICDNCIWIDNGKVLEIGETSQVINSYLSYMDVKKSE